MTAESKVEKPKTYTQAEVDEIKGERWSSATDSAADTLERWAEQLGRDDMGDNEVEVAILRWAAAKLRASA